MFAMLLLVVVPGISQYVMADMMAGQGMHHVLASDGAPCPEHAGHAAHADHDGGMPDHGMEHGDACGYCSLLSHTPLTPTIAALPAFAVTMPEPARAEWPVQHVGDLPQRHAAPRGPPQVFFG